MANWMKPWRWLNVEPRAEDRGSGDTTDPTVQRLRAMGLLSGAPQTEEVRRVLELMRARDDDEKPQFRRAGNAFKA